MAFWLFKKVVKMPQIREDTMTKVTLEQKEHSACCNYCGRFEFATKDIGHFHRAGEVSCLRCEYLAKCPTCENLVYVGERLSYIQLSELFVKRSDTDPWNNIISYVLPLGGI